MSYSKAIRDIKDLLIELWSNATSDFFETTPELRHQGVEGSTLPPNTFWGRLSTQTVIQDQAGISSTIGKQRYESEGLLFVEIYAPKIIAGSFMTAIDVAGSLRELLLRANWPCGVRFSNVRVSEGRTDGHWTQVRLIADWSYWEILQNYQDAFVPTDIPDLFSWGRGDADSLIISDRYFSIQDKIDPMTGFYQETAIRRPLAYEYNGNLVPFFSPSSTHLLSSRPVSDWIFLCDGSDFTVFCKIITQSLIQTSPFFNLGGSVVSSVTFAIQTNSNGSARIAVTNGSEIVILLTSATNIIKANSAHSICCRKIGIRYEVWVDGVLLNFGNSSAQPSSNLPPRTLCLGGNGQSNTMLASMPEWLTYKRALLDSELQSVFNYLAQEWPYV